MHFKFSKLLKIVQLRASSERKEAAELGKLKTEERWGKSWLGRQAGPGEDGEREPSDTLSHGDKKLRQLPQNFPCRD